jgi:MFS family permease
MSSTPSSALSLAELPRNARNAILLEPLWAVFGTVVLYYGPLYMSAVGLSSAQIGVIGSASLLASFGLQLLAAPITNRFGRKRTTLIGDLLSWTLPMLIWSLADGFGAFMAAALLASIGSIVSVSWSLLVIEDVHPAQRARVFGIMGLISAVSGLLTPLVGWLMTRWGVVPTLRTYYALGCVGMTVMFVWRNAVTSETQAGAAAMLESRALSPLRALRHNLGALTGLGRTPGLGLVVAFYVATVFLEQIGVFRVLYFEQALGFSPATLSLVPVAVAITTVSLYLGVQPRLGAVSGERVLVYTSLLGLIGALGLLFIPPGQLGLLLLGVAVIAAATFLTQTLRSSVLFAHLPPERTAALYSGVQALTVLSSVPASALAGALFAWQPQALLFLVTGFQAALLVLAWAMARRSPPRVH